MNGTKVLLFHKDKSVLQKLSQSLGSSNFSVISSSDISYTLELAKQEKPHFLIWGDELNNQSKNAIQLLKQTDAGSAVSIIAIADSNGLKAEKLLEAQNLGVDDFIPHIKDAKEIQSRIYFHQRYVDQIKFSKEKTFRYKKLSETTLSLMLTRGIVNICDLLNDFFSASYQLNFHIIAVDTTQSGDFDYFNLVYPGNGQNINIEKIQSDPIWRSYFISTNELHRGLVTDTNVLKTFQKWGIVGN
jgi:response regulator RpfG family c-di-GMP phosphodiesterase